MARTPQDEIDRLKRLLRDCQQRSQRLQRERDDARQFARFAYVMSEEVRRFAAEWPDSRPWMHDPLQQ